MASLSSCCGCGSRLDKGGRRSVNNSTIVMNSWKQFLDVIGKSCDMEDVWMCRKCFLAYERFWDLTKEITKKLVHAMTVITQDHGSCSSAPNLAKRPRMDPLLIPPAPQQPTSSSPDVAVHVNYANPKSYLLTPHRKRLGKAVARKSPKAIADECMKNRESYDHIVAIVCRSIREEVRTIASTKMQSALLCKSKESIYGFRWQPVKLELQTHAPLLLRVLNAATTTRTERMNQDIVVVMCFALILKHRNPTINLLQKIISLILYSGHCSKQVYQRLQPLNITVSYSSLLRLLDKIGENHDARVKSWKHAIVDQMKNSEGTSGLTTCQYHDVSGTSESPELESDESDSELDSDSDSSWRSVSPITSDEEYWSDDKEEAESVVVVEESEVPSGSHTPQPSPIPSQPVNNDEEEAESVDVEESEVPSGSHTPQPSPIPSQQVNIQCQPTFYRLCGDNIDKTVRHRYIRTDSQAASFHYFHSYAAADRVDFSQLPSEVPSAVNLSNCAQALLLLPSLEDEEALRKNFKVLISRVLCDFLPFFRATFDGIVTWHIQHPYYDEMSKKSDTVPLGILPKNENKGEEMVEIVKYLHQYVPVIRSEEEQLIPSRDETVHITKAQFSPVLFGGDQLTAARIRGAKKAKVSDDDPSNRMEGIIPVAEDWHTKMNFLGVLWKHYYSTSSAGEHGTLFQLRNRLGRSNVVSDPTKDFNACEDFFLVVISAFIVAAAMKVLKMKSIDEIPQPNTAIGETPDEVWMRDDQTRLKVLDDVCGEVIEKFVEFSFFEEFPVGKDATLSYSKRILGSGCFYLEYRDAVKEGDGTRVLRCWRYLLPIFYGTGRTNYSCEVLNMLHQDLTLPPRLASQLLWSRFINTHGVPGRNIPCDLYMEHLNRIAKDAIRALGANKTEQAVERVGKAIGTIAPLLQQYDEETNVKNVSGAHKRAKMSKDIEEVLSELMKYKVFSLVDQRKHTSFSSPKDLLHAKPTCDLQDWMVNRLKKIVRTAHS